MFHVKGIQTYRGTFDVLCKRKPYGLWMFYVIGIHRAFDVLCNRRFVNVCNLTFYVKGCLYGPLTFYVKEVYS